MKTPTAKKKTAAKSTPSAFPQAPRGLRANAKSATPPAKAKKRDNTFSKSRDTREDRGARQMKNAKSSQTFPHVR